MASHERFQATENSDIEKVGVCAPCIGFHTPGSAYLTAEALGLSPESVRILGRGNLVMFLMQTLHNASARNPHAERFFDRLYPHRNESSPIHSLAQGGFVKQVRRENLSLVCCHPSTAHLIHKHCPEQLAGVQITTVCLHDNAEYPTDVKYLVWYENARNELRRQGVPVENICLTSQLLPLGLAGNLNTIHKDRVQRAEECGSGKPLRVLVWPNGGGVLWKEDLLPFLSGLQESGLIGQPESLIEVNVMMGVNRVQVSRYSEWFNLHGVKPLVADDHYQAYKLVAEKLADVDLVISRPHLGAQFADGSGTPLILYGQPGPNHQGLRGNIERVTAKMFIDEGVCFTALPRTLDRFNQGGLEAVWDFIRRDLQSKAPNQVQAIAAINQTRQFLGVSNI